jgi:hypothetical protein
MVKIGIIGTGGVGVALGNGWQAKGHSIVFGSRDPNSTKSKEVTNKVKNSKVVSITDAIKQSEVIYIHTFTHVPCLCFFLILICDFCIVVLNFRLSFWPFRGQLFKRYCKVLVTLVEKFSLMLRTH